MAEHTRFKDPKIEVSRINDPRISDPWIKDPRIEDPVYVRKLCLVTDISYI